MKRLQILALSLLLLGGMTPAASAGDTVVITLPPTVEVESGELSLGQVAEIKAAPKLRAQLEQLTLGRAPRHGETVWLYRTNVVYALDRSQLVGAYTLEMPAKVKVTRAGQLLTAELLLAAVETQIGKYASDHWTAWRVEPGQLHERRIPQGELEFRFEGDQTPKPGLNTFRVGVVISGELFTTVPVTVRLAIQAPVYVSTQKLNRYTRLTADNCRREEQELTTGNEWLTELPADQYRVLREIPAGRVLTTRDLQEVPLIMEKSKVRLILNSGLIHVELTAQAEEDGWLHDQIIVTNFSSNQRLTATVVGPGTVEVTLE
ncbi:MAG TPA: flagella basal body P-ring formation protein FlgA [Firmicutes bacterium]|jgi:flagella basal body P-ring formation protein FlgA|nr:flagella basal body P-ring formation protein FlgA [Bacillota bacterium]